MFEQIVFPFRGWLTDMVNSTGQHRVVLNDEEQYSIWPAHKLNPPGWHDSGKEGSIEECLEHIGRVWTDITPRSLRRFPRSDTLAK